MIGIVIVNWNGRTLLERCLHALAKEEDVQQRIFVVDNGSEDGSLAYLAEHWPAVHVIPLGWNAGVAAGNNAGIRAALATDVTSILLLNNDAVVCSGSLPALTRAIERPGAWAATPKIVYRSDPNLIWSAGGHFNWYRGTACDRGTNAVDSGQFDEAEFVEYSNTCCLLIKREVFEKVGMMDESYYMYMDDADFSARMQRAKKGIVYEPAAVVLHDVQASSGRSSAKPSLFAAYYYTRNRPRFIARNIRNPLFRLSAHAFTLASRLVRVCQALAVGERREAVTVLEAMWDGYIRQSTGPSRRAIRSRS